jgi:hypothetical protein
MEKSRAAVTNAFSLSPANTDVARAKKVILPKKRTLGSDSSNRTASRRSIGVSELRGKMPATGLPAFVEPMKAMLVDSISAQEIGSTRSSSTVTAP